jgi:hypothetical protein
VDAGPRLIALAKTTMEQIQQALVADSSSAALQLFEKYLRTCKRTGGVVFAVGKDVVVLNDHARQLLDPNDKSVLLGQASESGEWVALEAERGVGKLAPRGPTA